MTVAVAKKEDFKAILGKYQANVTRELMQELASELNVDPDVLYRLEIGYADEVVWNSGNVDTSGWWVIPERNTHGAIVGLMLRNREDGERKVAYPNSKRGWTYELAEGFNPDLPRYVHGSHNWDRIDKLKIDCPLCGHPDGCMVPRGAPNPTDPDALICIQRESDRPMGTGFLHIIRPEGDIRRTNSPIRFTGQPILLVEGMTDVAAAMDIGFVAIGRPTSSTKKSKELTTLLHGQEVVIVGENDKGAGVAGMNQTYEAIHKRISTRRLMPPDHAKDLRAWKDKDQLTNATLMQAITDEAVQGRDERVFETKSSDHIAGRFVNDVFVKDGRVLLRKYHGEWYLFEKNQYVPYDKDRLKRAQYAYLSKRDYVRSDGIIKPYELGRARIMDVTDAMTQQCLVIGDPPAWINDVEGPAPQRLISYQNGILDVDEYVKGNVVLLPPTPDYFTLSCLPFDFDPDAVCPLWYKYGETTLDPISWLTLQEWFGYCLIPDNSREKICMLFGAPGSGKGTATNTLEVLVGKENIAGTNLKNLGGEHGLSNLVGTLVAIMGEARTGVKMDAVQALDMLLTISGQDTVPINKKYKDIVSQKLTCRFTMSLNVFPTLPDESMALLRRLVLIPFDNVISKEQKDDKLKDKLRAEGPGVTLWALEGLKRLTQQGDFTEPANLDKLIARIKRSMTLFHDFIDDCCLLEGKINKRVLYDCWSNWMMEKKMKPQGRGRFEERILSLPTMKIEGDYVIGLSIKEDAKCYLGRPQ